jgi:hypothetical protein
VPGEDGPMLIRVGGRNQWVCLGVRSLHLLCADPWRYLCFVPVVWGFTCLNLGIALHFSPVCFWWDLAIYVGVRVLRATQILLGMFLLFSVYFLFKKL